MMDVVCSWWCQRKRGSKKGRQDVKGGKSRMREPISSELPSSLPKGSSLKTWRKNTSRTWKETNWGAPRSSSTKKGLSQACSRVRTAGDRGRSSLAEPLANPQLAGSVPPRLALCRSSQHPGHLAQGSSAQAISWLLTDRGHFLNYSETWSVHPSTALLQSDHYDNKQVSPYWSSWRHLFSASKLREYRVSATHRVKEQPRNTFSGPKGCPTASNIKCLPY